MKRLVLSVGTGPSFARGLRRLRAGLETNGYEGDVRLLAELPEGCPRHEDMPYAFKPWAIHQAAEDGYDQVLYMDSACVPVQPIDRLWWMLRRDGILLAWNPDSVGEWCSDACLEAFGISRTQAMGMRPSVWASVVGLEMDNAKSRAFLGRWYAAAMDGKAFRGAWDNPVGQVSKDPRIKGHRFDQATAGLLAYILDLPLNQHVVQYDVGSVMPIRDYEKCLRLPWYPTPILHNHNVRA